MYYFDRKYLAQYVDQKIPLKVYASGDWHNIPSLKDLEGKRQFVGYDEFGDGTSIDYRLISKIKVGNHILTIEQLNTRMNGSSPDEKPEKEKTAPAEEEPTSDDTEEPPAEEEPKPTGKKEPDLSHFSPAYDIGRQLMTELRRKNEC